MAGGRGRHRADQVRHERVPRAPASSSATRTSSTRTRSPTTRAAWPSRTSSNSIYGGTLGGPDRQEQAVLLRRLGALRGPARLPADLRVPIGEDAQRRLQRGGGGLSRPSASTTRPPAARAASAGTQFPNGVIPANRLSPVWRNVLDYYPQPNTAPDLNSQPPGRRLRAGARGHERPRQLRHEADLAALALAQHLGQVRHAGRRGASTSSASASTRAASATRASTSATVGHTWTLSPNLVLDGNIGMNRHGPAGHRSRLRPEPRPRRSASRRQRARRARRAACPHFDIPNGTLSAGGTDKTLYDIGTTPNWMPLFRNERSYTFSYRAHLGQGPAPDPHRHRRRAPRSSTTSRPSSAASAACAAASSSAASPPPPPATSRRSGTSWPAFVLGLPTHEQKDVQPEEMTGREWQYALLRQRPLAGHRQADPEPRPALRDVPADDARDRGIERLDYNTYEVLLGGLRQHAGGRRAST